MVVLVCLCPLVVAFVWTVERSVDVYLPPLLLRNECTLMMPPYWTISARALVNTRDFAGRTPLHQAAALGTLGD